MNRKIFLALFLIISSFTTFAAPEETLDRVVAVVNDSVITESELAAAILPIKNHLAGENTPLPPEKVLRKQVLDQLINRKLQLQIADQLGLHADNKTIDKAISHIAKQNKISTAELYGKISAEGLSKKQYRLEIGEQLILQQLQQHEVGTDIHVTPQEINDFLRSDESKKFNNKEFHLKDILVSLPDTPSATDIANGKSQAEKLIQYLRKGLSIERAVDKITGNVQVQDLDWRDLTQLPSLFVEKVPSMRVNQIVGPIQAPNGFHLLKLVGVKPKLGFEQSKTQVANLLFQRKYEDQLQVWMNKLRGQAYIKINI